MLSIASVSYIFKEPLGVCLDVQAQQGLIFELTEPQGGCWTHSKTVVIATES